MHVISEKPLRDFWAIHRDSEPDLRAWLQAAKSANWQKSADIRGTFRDSDQVGKFTVFNIVGNKYRLITVVHFNRGRLYVRHLLTHAEYMRNRWKDD